MRCIHVTKKVMEALKLYLKWKKHIKNQHEERRFLSVNHIKQSRTNSEQIHTQKHNMADLFPDLVNYDWTQLWTLGKTGRLCLLGVPSSGLVLVQFCYWNISIYLSILPCQGKRAGQGNIQQYVSVEIYSLKWKSCVLFQHKQTLTILTLPAIMHCQHWRNRQIKLWLKSTQIKTTVRLNP